MSPLARASTLVQSTFELAGFVMVATQVLYGTSFVWYSSYLPTLVQRSQEVASAPAALKRATYQRTLDTWSSQVGPLAVALDCRVDGERAVVHAMRLVISPPPACPLARVDRDLRGGTWRACWCCW
jgi:hypothetical protein